MSLGERWLVLPSEMIVSGHDNDLGSRHAKAGMRSVLLTVEGYNHLHGQEDNHCY